MELTKDLIKNCLKELRIQQRKHLVNKRYYEGDHDILHNYTFNEERANMKVVINFFKKFVNDEVAYSLGLPLNYIHKDSDETITDEIDLNFSHWEKRHNQKLAIKTATYGFAFELNYINKDNEFRSTVLDPMNCFVLESGDAEKKVILAMHNYKQNKFSNVDMLDIYWENKIYTYRLDRSDRLFYESERESSVFLEPPIIVNEYNEERQSMLNDIKTSMDAYNTIISDITNEVSDFRAALIKVTGAKLEQDKAKEMKKAGIVHVPTKGTIDYLIKNINDTFIQNTLNTHEEKIYKLASHIDTNEKLQSNLSSLALRSRMIALENKCTLIQSTLESTIKQRLKNFFKFKSILDGQQVDYRKIKLKFTMNIPSDVTALADAVSKLKDTVPQRTLLSLLPNVENPDQEMAQFYKELRDKRALEMEGMVDLQNLGLNETGAEVDE